MKQQSDNQADILELFCGMGGLSLGFKQNGFSIDGIDIDQKVGRVFVYNKIGKFFKKDLLRSRIHGKYKIVLGGPPCKPWSCLNLHTRHEKHPLYDCLAIYFKKINRIKPSLFIMENVPSIQKDPCLQSYLKVMEKSYKITKQMFKYSDYGSSFSRKRFFVIGIKSEIGIDPATIAESIEFSEPVTIRHAIEDLRDKDFDPSIDHIWPKVKTIDKYLKYYASGKYGWYILDWDSLSPSFGNITKTYILHPDSFKNGNQARPISVREAMRIVGFPDEYRFPEGIDLRSKYEMIAQSVSPVFSFKLAHAIRNTLGIAY